MPIFYKGKERVIFAHIPKTAGISIYTWFCDNNWFISNLKLHSPGSGDIFLNRYGIRQCQIEGHQVRGVTPQHAIAATYSTWGSFTSGFTIVRNPLQRYFSELRYYFNFLNTKSGESPPTKKSALEFAIQYTMHCFTEYSKNPNFRDNHIRPQIDFISRYTEVIKYESNWIEHLKCHYHLKGYPQRLNQSPTNFDFEELMPQKIMEAIVQFYEVDYRQLNYTL